MDKKISIKKLWFRITMMLFPLWLPFIWYVLALLGVLGSLSENVLNIIFFLPLTVCVLYVFFLFCLLFSYIAEKESSITAVIFLTGTSFCIYAVFCFFCIFFGGWGHFLQQVLDRNVLL